MLIYLNILEENDKIQFEKIYKDNYLRMYHVALRVLQQCEDAENAVQDAFISLAENFEKYKDNNNENMKSLCNIIVRNKAMDILRKRTLRNECEMDENIEIDKSKNVENIIESKEEIDAFLLLLGKLDEQTKLIFVLKYFHDYKNGDIAKVLNISKRTVEMTIYRTKIKLKEGMDYDG